jgi:hypothetical protein
MTNAIKNEAINLAALYGYAASEITKINMSDQGELAIVELGTDADGFGIFILNFSL